MRTFLAVFFASCVISQYVAARRGRENAPPLPVAFDEDDVITIVNKYPVRAWKAERTKFFNNRKKLTQLLGTNDLSDDDFDKVPKVNASARLLNRAVIPAEFDSRTKWPTCASIKEIRDQGGCGSCWAVSVASALSDRICIKSSTKYTYAHISTQDLMTCCKRCGGCNGGIVEYAYEYFAANGSVTGGEYTPIKVKQTGCRPYTIPIEYADWTVTPVCDRTCQSNYHRLYSYDKYQGTGYSAISKLDGYGGVTEDTENNIKAEIMTNGPVSCSMKVYEDFGTYKSGVYQHLTGGLLGGHAVKCIGWGVDSVSGLPYWLAANSWGPDWGEQGFFRIRRGNNECNIEGRVNAGFPMQYG